MVVVEEVKLDRMICTIAIRYPHDEVPPEEVANTRYFVEVMSLQLQSIIVQRIGTILEPSGPKEEWSTQ
jgi:hypothetical protein